MKSILLYTENYDPGGGNRYLVDFIRTLPPEIKFSVASNRGAFFPGDEAGIEAFTKRYELGIKTPNLRTKAILERFGLSSNIWMRRFLDFFQQLPGIRVLLSLENAWFNRAIFDELLGRQPYIAVIAFSGGFPTALSCFDLAAAARHRGIKTAMSVVSMPQRYSYSDRLFHRDYEAIDRFIVNCEAIRQDLASSRGIALGQIEVLHNCAGRELPKERPTSAKGYPNGPKKDSCVFGYVGRVQQEKGIYELLEAFAAVRANRPDVSLRLFGKVYNRERVEATIAHWGIGESVELAGFFEGNVENVLSDFDVFVFPSRWEGFPYSLLEAMSTGLAVVATRVGGVPELVRDGENGILVPKMNPTALASAMTRLADDPLLCERYSRAARETIRTEYLFESFERKARQILENLIEEHE